MEPFAGFEPQIGEIRAVRTFRIGPGGVLYPLFRDIAWSPGINTATCAVVADPPGLAGMSGHDVPEPDCTCGYYAYASELAASEYPASRHVLAVVSCWGRVIAGTRGIRTQHAQLEAIWLSDAVPPELVAAVADRYTSASVYSDKQQMLDQHPVTVLECYEPDASHRAGSWRTRATVTAALFLGLLPHTWLSSNHDLLLAWWSAMTLVVGTAAISYRHHGPAAQRRVIQSLALALWLLSPFGGTAGILLLRLPLIQVAALIGAQRRVLAREANRFPARISGDDR